MRLHVDTDFAGDTDDACALALALGSDDVELTGLTTVADPDGRRAGYLDYFLQLADRRAPLAAGAGRSITTGEEMGGLPDHATYWGDATVQPKPGTEAAALALLEMSISAGATILAIGPCTNLALLDEARPGLLEDAQIVLMGGWITPPRPGLPPWGPDMDWNVQCDALAAERVFREAGELTLMTVPASLDAHLRARDLDRLKASGRLGRLLARQAVAHAAEHEMTAFGHRYKGLPDDLLNFQYDVAACAAALGMPSTELVDRRLVCERNGPVLSFAERGGGREVSIAAAVNGEALNEAWLASVEHIDASARA